MASRAKAPILVGTAIAGAIAVLYTISTSIFLTGFANLEEQSIRRDSQRTLDTLLRDQANLDVTASDYAAWDDTYAFVGDANREYVTANLVESTFTRLRLNLILITDPAGKIVFGQGFDLSTQTATSIPQSLYAHLSFGGRLVQHRDTGSSVAGVLLLPEGPMLVASRPILTSHFQGPIRGALIMGRYLSDEEITRLAGSTRLSLDLRRFDDAQMPADFLTARSTLSSDMDPLVQLLSDESIAAYVRLSDIYEQPALILRVDSVRSIYQQGQATIGYFVISLVGLGVIIEVATLVFFAKLEGIQRRQQEIVRSLFNGVPAGLYRSLPNGQLLDVNPALIQLLGYPNRESLLAINANELYVDPGELQRWHTIMQHEHAAHDFEAQLRKRDGTLIWIEDNARAICNPAGQVIYYEGSLKDITKRKSMEEALRASDEQFRQLAENIHEVFWIASPDMSQIHYVSPTYEDIWGRTCESLYAEPASLMDCVHPEDRKRLVEKIEKQQRGEAAFAEYRILRPDGSIGWIWDRAFPIRNGTGGVYRIAGTAEDVTEIKRADADVRAALAKEKELNQLKSSFITTASHEFRTPLTAILTSADLLERYNHKLSEEKRSRHLRQIQTSVKNMTRLLEDVLVIGRAEADKLEFKPDPLDLEQFCRGVLEEMQLSAGNGHSVKFVSQDPCAGARVDEKLLRQILVNLLSNAIKYSPDDSLVEFELTRHQDQAVFQVRDQGIGIPQEDQARLFDTFHRAGNVGNIPGTGLGMAIVKKSVELHGGTIAFTSQVGFGTTFTVVLPLHPSANGGSP